MQEPPAVLWLAAREELVKAPERYIIKVSGGASTGPAGPVAPMLQAARTR